MQNNIPITAILSKFADSEKNSNVADICFSKPEIVISRLWIELCQWNFADRHWPSEDSNVTQSETGSKIKLRRIGRHFEKRYDIITLPRIDRFGWNLAFWCKIAYRLRQYGRIRNRKKNSNMAVFYFSKSETVISQPRIKIFRRNLFCW